MIHLLESKRIVYQSGVFEGEISDHMKKKRNEREEEDMKNMKRHAWIFTNSSQIDGWVGKPSKRAKSGGGGVKLSNYFKKC